MECSDGQLVAATLAGDLESFGLLCSRYYKAMLAISYAVLSDHHLAEDAVQEGFARALVNLKQLRRREKFAFWLGRICRNVARTMAKNQARETSRDDFSQVAAPTSSDETSSAIRQAVDQLNSAARELIVLRYYNNLSYEQMAAVTGLSPAAINNRLGRAKRNIAAILKREGFRSADDDTI